MVRSYLGKDAYPTRVAHTHFIADHCRNGREPDGGVCPGLATVDQPIVVVHRSDGSGTTFGFTDYLSTVSPDWKSKVGNATSVNWPVGLGGSGNPGVAGEVQENPYSIGYVELIYAVGNKLDFGMVKNKAGQWIDP